MTAEKKIILSLEQSKDWLIAQFGLDPNPNLTQVDHALDIARHHRYGFCERCGKRIEDTFLSASMHITRCNSCQDLINE